MRFSIDRLLLLLSFVASSATEERSSSRIANERQGFDYNNIVDETYDGTTTSIIDNGDYQSGIHFFSFTSMGEMDGMSDDDDDEEEDMYMDIDDRILNEIDERMLGQAEQNCRAVCSRNVARCKNSCSRKKRVRRTTRRTDRQLVVQEPGGEEGGDEDAFDDTDMFKDMQQRPKMQRGQDKTGFKNPRPYDSRRQKKQKQQQQQQSRPIKVRGMTVPGGRMELDMVDFLFPPVPSRDLKGSSKSSKSTSSNDRARQMRQRERERRRRRRDRTMNRRMDMSKSCKNRCIQNRYRCNVQCYSAKCRSQCWPNVLSCVNSCPTNGDGLQRTNCRVNCYRRNQKTLNSCLAQCTRGNNGGNNNQMMTTPTTAPASEPESESASESSSTS